MPIYLPPQAVRSNSTAMQSIHNQIQYRMLQISHYGQPTIDIELDESQHEASRAITSYSTMDTIQGKVHVTAQHDTKFREIEISFAGTAQVFVERLSTTPSMSGRTEAAHKFLTLKMPINPADLPSPPILRANYKYTFPFTFTIPAQLLPKSCPHVVASDYVRSTHLMLPPSLGDPSVSGFGATLLDDLSPEMAKITYGVRARVLAWHDAEQRIALLGQKIRKLRVKPVFEEQPPLNVDGNQDFRPRLERKIKKGLFKGRTGTLVAEAAQPKPLVVPGARTLDADVIVTRAKVVLRFDPADDTCLPPALGSLKTHIKASTFYASSPRQNFPSRSSLATDQTQGAYTDSIPLSTLHLGPTFHWTKRSSSESPPADDPSRRDSGISDCSSSSSPPSDPIPLPSSTYAGAAFYTASILVPITLPLNKNFLPTFHSCLVSRSYALVMGISVKARGVGESVLSVKVPIQVCAEGSVTGMENARVRREEVRTGRIGEGEEGMYVEGEGDVEDDVEERPPGYGVLGG